MPVRKVAGGYKYGNSGKLYKGKDAKAKAEKQAAAIHASGYREPAKGNTVSSLIKKGKK